MLNITLRNLRAFAAVARFRSFTRAAEQLAISQPALTSSIRQLEEAVGVRLLDRTTRRVSLTVEGHALLPSAEQILQDSESAVLHIRDLAERRRGSVSIACVASFARNVISPAVLAFAQRYPGIAVRVRVADSESIRRLVLEAEVDLGYASVRESDPALATSAILEDSVGLLCPGNHPLVRRNWPVRWVDALPYPFIGLANSDILASVAEAVPELAARVFPLRYEIESVEVLNTLIANGLGIAAQPVSSFAGEGSGLVFVPVVDPVVTRTLSEVTCVDRSLSTAADGMRAIIADEVRRMIEARSLLPPGGHNGGCPEKEQDGNESG